MMGGNMMGNPMMQSHMMQRDPRLPRNARPGDWMCNSCNNHNYADKMA